MDLHPGEQVVFKGRPSWRALLSVYLGGLVLAGLVGAIAALVGSAALGAAVAAALYVVVLVVGFVKRVGTRYVITNQRLYIRRGLLAKREQQTRIDRVQNVNTAQRLLERILRVGTVDFDTAGTGDADFRFVGIANPGSVVRAVDTAQREAAASEPQP
jgi:uncharacterized membrane protein YdbT with pleckstrin-like domain